MSKKGLPLSVQIMARPGEDETTLAFAAQLVGASGGWQLAQVVPEA
jgi:Asp-tRNA(Asn)/Glu-tRNA(Gln) amidotransferase A subunit family amidase